MSATAARIRVLVVDDSAFARKVIREVLTAAPDLEVVGIARDGLEALEKIGELAPDVVTLDLVMPELDGLGVLRALPARGGPRVVVVSVTDADSELAIEALQTGAVDLVHKPTTLATDRLYELGDELIARVRLAAGARVRRPAPVPTVAGPAASATRTRLVVIGASTGGPQAFGRLLPALPAAFPVPVVLALHIPAGFTGSLAERLDRSSALTVREAGSREALRAGEALLAPGGAHLVIEPDGRGGLVARTSAEPNDSAHRPSIDVLFESAARAAPGAVLGVVLTGMGSDGLAGARAIVASGGVVLAESETSCIVYGMPRVVIEAGLARAEAPLESLPDLIVRHL